MVYVVEEAIHYSMSRSPRGSSARHVHLCKSTIPSDREHEVHEECCVLMQKTTLREERWVILSVAELTLNDISSLKFV